MEYRVKQYINSVWMILFSLAKEGDFGTNLFSGPYQASLFAQTVRRSISQPGVHFSDLESYQASGNRISGFLTRAVSDEFLHDEETFEHVIIPVNDPPVANDVAISPALPLEIHDLS